MDARRIAQAVVSGQRAHSDAIAQSNAVEGLACLDYMGAAGLDLPGCSQHNESDGGKCEGNCDRPAHGTTSMPAPLSTLDTQKRREVEPFRVTTSLRLSPCETKLRLLGLLSLQGLLLQLRLRLQGLPGLKVYGSTRSPARGDHDAVDIVDFVDLVDAFYRLEYWNPFLARLCPYFLRSFMRGSRVSSPSLWSAGRTASSLRARARAMPCRTAPAWPEIPPPSTVASTSNRPSTLAVLKGCRITVCSERRGKYCSNGCPFTRIFPLPGSSRTRATAFLRRPVPMEIACTTTRLPPHFQLLRFLREVRMLRPAVDPQVFDQSPAERILGQHAPNRIADELLRFVLEHVPEGERF